MKVENDTKTNAEEIIDFGDYDDLLSTKIERFGYCYDKIIITAEADPEGYDPMHPSLKYTVNISLSGRNYHYNFTEESSNLNKLMSTVNEKIKKLNCINNTCIPDLSHKKYIAKEFEESLEEPPF